MATHYIRTVTCPHCGNRAEHTNQTTKHLLGSPFRRCVSCGEVYFDKKYEEPAIAIYNGSGRFEGTIARLIVGLILTGVLISSIFSPDSFGDMPAGILIVLLLLGPGLLIHSISFLYRSSQKRVVDNLENHPEKLPEETQRSLERLSDQDYIDTLRSFDYEVPTFFDELIKKKNATSNMVNMAPETPAPQTIEIKPKRNFCPKCGTRLAGEEKYCPNCGRDLST